MTPEQILADVAARIRAADEASVLSAAAFAGGPKTAEAYLESQRAKILREIEETFGDADSKAGDS